MRSKKLALFSALVISASAIVAGSAKAGTPLSETWMDRVTAGTTGVAVGVNAYGASTGPFPVVTLAATDTNAGATGGNTSYAVGAGVGVAIGNQQATTGAGITLLGSGAGMTSQITVNTPYASGSVAVGVLVHP